MLDLQSDIPDKVEAQGPFVIVGDVNARLHGGLMDEGAVIGPFVLLWRC